MYTRSSSDGVAICYVLPVLWMTFSYHGTYRHGKTADRIWMTFGVVSGVD